MAKRAFWRAPAISAALVLIGFAVASCNNATTMNNNQPNCGYAPCTCALCTGTSCDCAPESYIGEVAWDGFKNGIVAKNIWRLWICTKRTCLSAQRQN